MRKAMKRFIFWVSVFVLASACEATGTAGKTANPWRTGANGVQVYMGGPPGGIKRVVGTIYADAHSETDAIEALTEEAARLRADAIYGVSVSQELPGQQRRPGSGDLGDPIDRGGKGSGDPFGDYSSERRMRTWKATAVILEPAAPAERVSGEPQDPSESDNDDTESESPSPEN